MYKEHYLSILLIVDFFFLIFIDLRFFLTNESVNLLSAALLPEKNQYRFNNVPVLSQGFPPRVGFGPGRGGFDGPPGPPGFRPNFRGGFNRGGFGPGGPGILVELALAVED